MELMVRDLVQAVGRAEAVMPALEQELNAADALLGDGDTGGMLVRVVAGLAKTTVREEDLGAAFLDYAKAAGSATGSSLGTLFATALLAMGRGTKGRPGVPLAELGPLLAVARDAMLKRGQASLGDKTVIDVLDAVSRVIEGKSEWAAIAPAAAEVATATLERFRGEPCGIGRARMFGDKSRGLDDPGMLAFVRLTLALATDA
jgi:dihydroxyacetone kinase-like protein